MIQQRVDLNVALNVAMVVQHITRRICEAFRSWYPGQRFIIHRALPWSRAGTKAEEVAQLP
jgi:hypothetical protein